MLSTCRTPGTPPFNTDCYVASRQNAMACSPSPCAGLGAEMIAFHSETGQVLHLNPRYLQRPEASGGGGVLHRTIAA